MAIAFFRVVPARRKQIPVAMFQCTFLSRLIGKCKLTTRLRLLALALEDEGFGGLGSRSSQLLEPAQCRVPNTRWQLQVRDKAICGLGLPGPLQSLRGRIQHESAL